MSPNTPPASAGTKNNMRAQRTYSAPPGDHSPAAWARSISVRFSEIPGNSGIGLEMKAIAAVVVGGTAITGGRGRLIGTLIGVALLGTIGTALTFVGINPFWEKAIQGAIILAALVSDVALGRLEKNGKFNITGADAA